MSIQSHKRNCLKIFKVKDPIIERSLQVIGFKDLALTEDRYNALVHHMTHIDLIKNVPTYSEFCRYIIVTIGGGP